ncbi:hypothetical protein [Marilutibacter aestuarii]|uniref:hypothetical protein n=1 Tax=Marilutibacter aestuarii TaxID=1706195 RepID=UPI001476C489|nr:hypothetical protein [Lysobacter aestuarii]
MMSDPNAAGGEPDPKPGRNPGYPEKNPDDKDDSRKPPPPDPAEDVDAPPARDVDHDPA